MIKANVHRKEHAAFPERVAEITACHYVNFSTIFEAHGRSIVYPHRIAGDIPDICKVRTVGFAKFGPGHLHCRKIAYFAHKRSRLSCGQNKSCSRTYQALLENCVKNTVYNYIYIILYYILLAGLLTASGSLSSSKMSGLTGLGLMNLERG